MCTALCTTLVDKQAAGEHAAYRGVSAAGTPPAALRCRHAGGGYAVRMSSSLSNLYAAAEVHRELPMPAPLFGIIAFALFLLALGVLWMFRGTAHRLEPQGTHHGADQH